MKNLLIATFAIIIGVAITYILRFFTFFILVPDPCIYHNGAEEGFLLKKLYSFEAVNGYHPEPNLLNDFIIITIGVCFGIIYFLGFSKINK